MAFNSFGLSPFDMTLDKFLDNQKYDVFSFGNPPISIDIMTKVKGVHFDDCFERSEWFPITETLQVRALRLSDLLEAKQASGRPKDKDDIMRLKKKNRL
jgi:hypothetical protein